MKLLRTFHPAASAFLRLGTPLLLAVLALIPAHAQDQKRGRKYKDPPPVAHISVSVVRATNGKPVENAAVIFHTFHDGKDEGNMEIKTNEDGKATLDVIPIGDEVQVQVFKAGYQTYGDTFTNDQPTRNLEIAVKRPSGQYSMYQKAPVDSTAKQSVTPQATQGAAKPNGQPN